MSQAKREQLIESGQLHPDGSRINRCPTCGQEVDEATMDVIRGGGAAVAAAESVEMTGGQG